MDAFTGARHTRLLNYNNHDLSRNPHRLLTKTLLSTFKSLKIEDMVSAYLADALRDPTAELRELYTTRDPSADFAKTVADHFSRVFSADTAFTQVRSCSVLTRIKHSALLRFLLWTCGTHQIVIMTVRSSASAAWCRIRLPRPKCTCRR